MGTALGPHETSARREIAAKPHPHTLPSGAVSDLILHRDSPSSHRRVLCDTEMDRNGAAFVAEALDRLSSNLRGRQAYAAARADAEIRGLHHRSFTRVGSNPPFPWSSPPDHHDASPLGRERRLLRTVAR